MIGDDVVDLDSKGVGVGELDVADEALSFRELTDALRESLGRFAACGESTTSAARLRLFFPGGTESPNLTLLVPEVALFDLALLAPEGALLDTVRSDFDFAT
jgi:hypothetical protein